MKSADKLLTALELKVMNILWDLERAFVKEIIEKWSEEPVPAYNTVSTIVRILEEKGYAGHETFGRSYRYYPEINRAEYQKKLLGNVLDNAFSGSFSTLVSTLVEGRNLSDGEVEVLKDLIEKSDR